MFFKLKNLSYLQVLSSFFFLILIFFFLFIHFSGKCDLKEFQLISKSFNFKTAYNNCEQSITNAVKYRLISKISGEKISDSDFKISFDEFVLKKDESKFQKKPNIKKGLINNIDNYLIDIEKDYFLKNNFTSWTRSHGGYSNLKFSTSNQITPSTAKRLKLFWKYDADFHKKNWKVNVETNPIFYDGIIYSVTADHKLIALDVLNKKLKWQIQSPKVIAKRGFLIDTNDKSSPQIFTPIGKKIFKINAKDGKINETFGINGSINFFTLVTPFIFNEKICAAGLRKINCFDKISGKEIFSINLHNKEDRGGNVWGGVAFDIDTGYAYVVTGNPRPALIGVNRREKNKNANSIIAVSLKEKKLFGNFKIFYMTYGIMILPTHL